MVQMLSHSVARLTIDCSQDAYPETMIAKLAIWRLFKKFGSVM